MDAIGDMLSDMDPVRCFGQPPHPEAHVAELPPALAAAGDQRPEPAGSPAPKQRAHYANEAARCSPAEQAEPGGPSAGDDLSQAHLSAVSAPLVEDADPAPPWTPVLDLHLEASQSGGWPGILA
jgi:hypothetical protein